MREIVTAIHALPPLREVIQAHDLRAEKKLGQNFLLDLNLTDKIARSAGDLTNQIIFEIGPGPGGLTRALLTNGAACVIAVEYDARAVMALSSLAAAAQGRLIVLPQDALMADLPAIALAHGFSPPVGIVANLPYNIATVLLIRWLKDIRKNHTVYNQMTLMFQKEVAQRIIATPSTKAYGRLSVMAQWLCTARIGFELPPSAFIPSPKVVSAIVHFAPRVPAAQNPSFDVMEKITRLAFGQRRKMLRGSLKPYAGFLAQAGLEETLRAEDVPVDGYIRLAMAIEQTGAA